MKKLLLGFILAMAITPTAKADLLLTPYNLVIEGRDRSAQMTLVNTGNYTEVYRLSWSQLKQAGEEGGYMEDPDEDQLRLQDFAVFTPRQITLEPNEKQVVRVRVRRPAELADGEYKSHLKFSAIPQNRKGLQPPEDKNAVKFGASLVYTHSVPVVYRVGEYDCQIGFGQPQISMNQARGKLEINVPLSRSGIHGVIGRVIVMYKEDGGEERQLTSASGVNMFPEINSRNLKIHTNETGLKPGVMTLKFVKYEGVSSEQVVFAEKSFPIRN